MSANTSINKDGLLINYEYCSGCHACEVACKQEHGLKKGQYGIRVFTFGPTQVDDDSWDFFNIPVPTMRCDLCADRVSMGKLPACVHHCQAKCMEFGTVEELSVIEGTTRTRSSLFTITVS